MTPEQRELEGLRKLYGAKFNAISAALGNVSEGLRLIEEEGDDESGLSLIRDAERILIDA